MIIVETSRDLREKMNEMQANKLMIGFVPTMGALHMGHLSLVNRANTENDKVVVSIFVNPTQFTNAEDLQKYPRMPEKDFEMLESVQADLVFYPSVKEIYPEESSKKEFFEFGNLEKVLEGKFRPGHFKGVGQVVSRLFELVRPDRAYFGEKDFQQLAVIRELVRQQRLQVEIIGCPTMREPDGLAMSSRNLLLTPELRKEAIKISEALFYIRDHRNLKSVKDLLTTGISMIEKSGKLRVEYLALADELTLDPVESFEVAKKYRCLAAVYAGNIRLIDNVQV